MRARLRVFDEYGVTYRGILPTTDLTGSFEVAGSGTLTFTANSTDLDAVNAWDSVIILDLGDDDTGWTASAIYALRPPWKRPKVGGYVPPAVGWMDLDVDWDDLDVDWLGDSLVAEPYVQQVTLEAIGLLEVWADETVLLPEYVVGNMSKGAGDERGLGWMSSAYDPATDPREPWDLCYDTDRTVFPDGFPTASGAVWISAHADLADPLFESSERKMFRAWADVPAGGPHLVRTWWSSDEGATLWIAGEPVASTDYVEEGRKFTQIADTVMWPGQYGIGLDTATHITIGGDGIDPVCLAMGILDTAGDVASWLLVSSETTFVACRRNDEPPGNEPPGPTPGALLRYLVTEAQERNCSGWTGVTLDFDDALDSYGDPWAEIVVERQYRYAHDSYKTIWAGLAETGEVDVWLTPDLVLHAGPKQGVLRELVLTAPQITTLNDGKGRDAGTWVAAVARDGWVDRSAAAGQRREFGLELGTAISRPIADRITAAVLDENGRWDAACGLQSGPHRPGIDFTAGDDMYLDYFDTPGLVRVLSLSFTAGDGGLLWNAELTDGGK